MLPNWEGMDPSRLFSARPLKIYKKKKRKKKKKEKKKKRKKEKKKKKKKKVRQSNVMK